MIAYIICLITLLIELIVGMCGEKIREKIKLILLTQIALLLVGISIFK